MKRLSSRAIKAKSRTKALYYASRSILRFGKRFAWAHHYKAQRIHGRRLLNEMREQGLHWPVWLSSWSKVAGEHRKQFNAHHIAMMEAEAQREKDRQARHDAEITEGVNRALLNLVGERINQQ